MLKTNIMKRTIIIIFILLSCCLPLSAQKSFIKDRWNVKAVYAVYPTVFFSQHGLRFTTGNYRLETTYGLFNFLELGGYLGYGRYSSQIVIVGQGPIYKNLNVPYFGLNLNFHPMGFLIKKPNFFFDLYLLGRYGGFYYASPDNYVPPKGFYSEIRHGVGLSIYPTKGFGLYVEGSFTSTNFNHWNYGGGLTLRL